MVVLPAEDEEISMETRDASPAHLLIRIESFSLLSEYGIQKYESREFEAGDHKWKLIIYPEGKKSDDSEDDHISVYLVMAGTTSLPSDWEVNAIFSIFLFNQILDNYLCFRGKMRRFHAMNPKWGFSKLISRKCLTDPSTGFLVDDTCVFGAEVFVVKSQRVIERLSLLKISEPYKRDWVFPKISKMDEDGFVTEHFTAGDHEWAIGLYPDGQDGEEDRSISICLELIGGDSFAPHEKVKVDFCMRIKNQVCKDHYSETFSHWFTCDEHVCDMHAFMPTADLFDSSKGFVVNDCCILETEISVQAVVVDE